MHAVNRKRLMIMVSFIIIALFVAASAVVDATHGRTNWVTPSLALCCVVAGYHMQRPGRPSLAFALMTAVAVALWSTTRFVRDGWSILDLANGLIALDTAKDLVSLRRATRDSAALTAAAAGQPARTPAPSEAVRINTTSGRVSLISDTGVAPPTIKTPI